ncbi:hypothetical protein FQA47_023449 [Oryzias melastigma]|uniref:Uncharacterized protein n=1 Tax=Oryzias melastigma TaxID=30732 RepID=A0A834C4C5_ORYME|nr:hypothetical protein FQA47_023449 [Oryzias melastigma]
MRQKLRMQQVYSFISKLRLTWNTMRQDRNPHKEAIWLTFADLTFFFCLQRFNAVCSKARTLLMSNNGCCSVDFSSVNNRSNLGPTLILTTMPIGGIWGRALTQVGGEGIPRLLQLNSLREAAGRRTSAERARACRTQHATPVRTDTGNRKKNKSQLRLDAQLQTADAEQPIVPIC